MLFVIRSTAGPHTFSFQRLQQRFFGKTGFGFVKEKQIGSPMDPSHFWSSLLLRQTGQLREPVIQLAQLSRDQGISLVESLELCPGQSRRDRVNAELGAESRALVSIIR